MHTNKVELRNVQTKHNLCSRMNRYMCSVYKCVCSCVRISLCVHVCMYVLTSRVSEQLNILVGPAVQIFKKIS